MFKTSLSLTILVVLLMTLSACSTILSGRTQTVTIETNPPGAACNLTREGRVIASIDPTPGGTLVSRTKHDISVVCKKNGYQDATEYLDSGIEGATFGNILAGGVIGWGVDSATGADNKYPDVKTITMLPVTPVK